MVRLGCLTWWVVRRPRDIYSPMVLREFAEAGQIHPCYHEGKRNSGSFGLSPNGYLLDKEACGNKNSIYDCNEAEDMRLI